MSDSDRGERTKVGLKRWLWPAIVFAVAALTLGGIQHRVHYEDAARNAASYASDAQNQIAAECTVPVSYDGCAREIEQSRRENQRDEYDLYAQKAMALWTAIMGAMAVVGIALSGIGVYLIWRTWDATREMATLTNQALQTERRREKVSNEPKIECNLVGLPFKAQQDCLGTIHLRNNGATKALVEDFVASVRIERREQGEAVTLPLKTLTEIASLLPRSDKTVQVTFDALETYKALEDWWRNSGGGFNQSWASSANIELSYRTEFDERITLEMSLGLSQTQIDCDGMQAAELLYTDLLDHSLSRKSDAKRPTNDDSRYEQR